MDNGDWYQRERLHRAAQEGNLAEAAKLLDRGFDPNVFDEIGKTPLHYAAAGEHADVVSLLLRRGARVDAHHEPSTSNTPLAAVKVSATVRICPFW